MDDVITIEQKHLYARRRSIMDINLCKKSLFKGIRNIYLFAFVLDPLFTQISVVVFCLLYETAAKTGVLRFFQEFMMEQATIRFKTNPASQFDKRIQKLCNMVESWYIKLGTLKIP